MGKLEVFFSKRGGIMRQNYLLILLEKTSFIVVLFLLISKLKIFKKIFEKDKYTQKDLFVISIIFTLLSIMGTYNWNSL